MNVAIRVKRRDAPLWLCSRYYATRAITRLDSIPPPLILTKSMSWNLNLTLARGGNKAGVLACFMAGLLVAGTGCHTTIRTHYAPTAPPIYTSPLQGDVTIGSITDKRELPAAAYYRSFRIWDKAKYDTNVCDLVREALTVELGRAGLTVHQAANPSTAPSGLTLNVEVLEYLADVPYERGLFKPNVLESKVALRFFWVDPAGKVVEEDERSESVTRKLGIGKAPSLPVDAAEIRGFGEELMNSLLPRTIEKEIRLNKVLPH